MRRSFMRNFDGLRKTGGKDGGKWVATHRAALRVNPFGGLRASPFAYAQGKKVRNIRGKIKNVGAPTFLGGVHSPCFCVSRGNKRHTSPAFVCRGNKGDRRSGPSPALWVNPSAALRAS